MTLDELLQKLFALGKVKVEITLYLVKHEESAESTELIAKCDKCGWKSKPVSSERAKARSLRAHAQHCTGNPEYPEWLREQTNSRD